MAHFGKHTISYKVKRILTISPAIRVYPPKIKTYGRHTCILIVALFIITKKPDVLQLVNKQTMAHLYNGILFCNKKKQNSDRHANMDESQIQYGKF